MMAKGWHLFDPVCMLEPYLGFFFGNWHSYMYQSKLAVVNLEGYKCDQVTMICTVPRWLDDAADIVEYLNCPLVRHFDEPNRPMTPCDKPSKTPEFQRRTDITRNRNLVLTRPASEIRAR